MDLQDKQLDALIQSALQQGANVTPQQRQLAWERLSQKAIAQTLVAPAPISPEKRLMMRLAEMGAELWRSFSSFAIEEDRYERARMNRYMLRYNGMRHSGDMSMQFLEPVRLCV